MRAIVTVIIGVAMNLFAVDSPGQTGSDPSLANIGKVELVCETKPGSGSYEVVEAVPLFPAFSGVGHGAPDLTKAKFIDLMLPSDLVATKVGKMKATISGPGGQFDGELTETAANSGTFTDDKKTVALVFPPGITTSPMADQYAPVISSDSLGLHHARFSLYSHTIKSVPPQVFMASPIQKAEVQFPSPYNPAVVNHLRATMVYFESDPETGATAGAFNPLSSDAMRYRGLTDFAETAPGSRTFFDPASKVTIRLSDFTGTDSSKVDRMDASFFGGLLGPEKQALDLTLTESTPNSMTFTEEATMGGNEDSGRTDEPTDNPEVSGDGVFRVRIKGGKGPVILILQSDINKVFVAATPTLEDPTTCLTGKLILVPKTSDTNTDYKTIQTLYTASAAESLSILLADVSGAQLASNDAEGFNDLAWILATCPEGALRDSKHAVQAAEKACDLSKWDNPNFIDTLATAYAEGGDFEQAVKWENYSLTLPKLTPDEAAEGKKHLALFQLHQPFHVEPSGH